MVATVFTSGAQVLLKLGVLAWPSLSWQLAAGGVLYALAAVLLLVSLRSTDLSITYPILATSYVWAAVLSYVVFNDAPTTGVVVGVAFIIAGVSGIGFTNRTTVTV